MFLLAYGITLLRCRFLDGAIAAEVEASQPVNHKPLLEVLHGLAAQLPAWEHQHVEAQDYLDRATA